MSIGIEKRIFTNITDVTTFLTSIGFTISNNKVLWSHAESNANCYFQIVNNIITFKRSDGESAFEKDLVNFNYKEEIEGETIARPLCGIDVIYLQNNGIAIYMGMLTEDKTISDVNICCANDNAVLNNGLVVISPADTDGHWWYGWNDPLATTSSSFYWCLDNGHGFAEYGTNVSTVAPVLRYDTGSSFTIVKSYLLNGYWSNNIYVQVIGDATAPGYIFMLNGQKYIGFTNGSSNRVPIYKLPSQSQEMNLSTSTEEYSPLKTYVVGDYCIYNGLLYKSRTAVSIPEPFDSNKWIVTTVPNEILGASIN